MKPSSIRLWSMVFGGFAGFGTLISATTSAEAWWRDRAYLDDGYVIESYPPGYGPRGPEVIYAAPRRWEGPVVYQRRRPVYVAPEVYDDEAYYEEVLPPDAYPDQ